MTHNDSITSAAAQRAAEHAFRERVAALGENDIAIDCGANIGLFTLPMALRRARVFAFEPNPHAFQELARRLAPFPNVTLREAAVALDKRPVPLHLHLNAQEDPLKWSTGSSLLPFKGNVSRDHALTVEAVDFAAFIGALDRPVALLKMDIEGAEVNILHRILDLGLQDRIGHAFVELHDAKIPELRPETERLRERVHASGLTTFNLNWA